MKNGERVFFVVCVCFFGFMFWQGLGQIGRGRAGEIGSGFWPLFALGGCTVLSAVRLVQGLRGSRGRKAGTTQQEEVQEHYPLVHGRKKVVLLTVGCFFLYLVAMPWIGFVLATFFFVPAVSLCLGERRWPVLALSPFLLTGIMVSVFARFIAIPFPRGVGIFGHLSRIFY